MCGQLPDKKREQPSKEMKSSCSDEGAMQIKSLYSLE